MTGAAYEMHLFDFKAAATQNLLCVRQGFRYKPWWRIPFGDTSPFPCSDNNNAAFYYVKQGPNNKIVIEGEGYIVTDPDKVARHKAMGRRDFGNKDIWYYWLDEVGNVIKKERK